jgi:hypothetical protein
MSEAAIAQLVLPFGEADSDSQAIGIELSGRYLPVVRVNNTLYFAEINDTDDIINYNIDKPTDKVRAVLQAGRYIIKTAVGDIAIPAVRNPAGEWVKKGVYEAPASLKSDALDKLLMEPVALFIDVPSAPVLDEPKELVDDNDLLGFLGIDDIDIAEEETTGILARFSTIDLDRIDRLLTDLYPNLDDLMLSKFSRSIVRMVKDNVVAKPSMAQQLLTRRGLPRWILPIVKGKVVTTDMEHFNTTVPLQDKGFTDLDETELTGDETKLTGDETELTGDETKLTGDETKLTLDEVFMSVIIPANTGDIVERHDAQTCNSPDTWYQCRPDFTMPVFQMMADKNVIRMAYGPYKAIAPSRLAVSGFMRVDNRLPYVRLFDIKSAKRVMLSEQDIESALNGLYPSPEMLLLENAPLLQACPNMRAVERILERYKYTLQDIDKDVFNTILRKRYVDTGKPVINIPNHVRVMTMVQKALDDKRQKTAHGEDDLLSESYGYIRQIQGLSATQLRILLNSTEDYGNNYYLNRVHRFLTDGRRKGVLAGLKPLPEHELPPGQPVGIHEPIMSIGAVVHNGKRYSISDYESLGGYEWIIRRKALLRETYSDMRGVAQDLAMSQRMLDYLIMQRRHDRRIALLESLDIRLATDYLTDSRITRVFDGFNLSTDEGRKQYVDTLERFTALNRVNLIDGFYRVRETGDIVCCSHFHYQLRSGLENFVEKAGEKPDFVEDADGFKRCKYCHSPITDDEDTGIQFTGGEMNLRHTFRHMITGERDSEELQEQAMLNSDLYIFLEHMVNKLLDTTRADLPSGKMGEMLREVYAYIKQSDSELLDPYSPNNRKYVALLDLLKKGTILNADFIKSNVGGLTRIIKGLNPTKSTQAVPAIVKMIKKNGIDPFELHTHFMLLENVRRLTILVAYLSYYVDIYSAAPKADRFMVSREWIVSAMRSYHAMRKQVWLSYKANIGRIGTRDEVKEAEEYIDTLIRMYNCQFLIAQEEQYDVILPWPNGSLQTTFREQFQPIYSKLQEVHAAAYASLAVERRTFDELREPSYLKLSKLAEPSTRDIGEIVEIYDFLRYEAAGSVDAARYLADMDDYTGKINEDLANFSIRSNNAVFSLDTVDNVDGAKYASMRGACYYGEMFLPDAEPLSVDGPLKFDGTVDADVEMRGDLKMIFDSYAANQAALQDIRQRHELPSLPPPESRGAMMLEDVPFHHAKVLTINSSDRVYDERYYPVMKSSKAVSGATQLEDESLVTVWRKQDNERVRTYVRTLIGEVMVDKSSFVVANNGSYNIFTGGKRDVLFIGQRTAGSMQEILYDNELTYFRTLSKVRGYQSGHDMGCDMEDFRREDRLKHGRWTLERQIMRMQGLGNYLSAAITNIGYKYAQDSDLELLLRDERIMGAIGETELASLLLQEYQPQFPEIYSISISELANYVKHALDSSPELTEWARTRNYLQDPVRLVSQLLPIAIRSDICRHIYRIRNPGGRMDGSINTWANAGINVDTRTVQVQSFVDVVDVLLDMAALAMDNMDPDHAEFDHLQYMQFYNKISVSKRVVRGAGKIQLDEGLAAAISNAAEVEVEDDDEEEGDGQPDEREESREDELEDDMLDGEGNNYGGEPEGDAMQED